MKNQNTLHQNTLVKEKRKIKQQKGKLKHAVCFVLKFFDCKKLASFTFYFNAVMLCEQIEQ